MGGEVLLYGYSAVCVSMLIFNILYYLSLNGRSRRMARESKRLRLRVDRQLEWLRQGEEVEQKHLTYLRRKLSRVNHLIAFDKMMTERREIDEDGEPNAELGEYYRSIQPVILHLAVVYRNRESVQAAYFAWFLAKHKMNQRMELDAVQDILVDYMNQDSLYCRVNAFHALCELGNSRYVTKALSVLDRNQKFFHDKLLTDSLLAFTGSRRELAQALLEQFDSFSAQTRLAVLNYVRFSSGDYCEWVLGILNDPAEDKELRLSAIRYFGRYVYPPAKPVLLELASDNDPLHWEYVAVSATALAAYEGEDVVDTLIGTIYSSNWYVRNNAADSLAARGLEYDDLAEVVGGGDRFVREIMLYHLRSRGESKEVAVE